MRKRTALLLGLIGLLLACSAGAFLAGAPGLAAFAAAAAGVLLLLWLGVKLFRRLLWSVGSRLAFSYFLIGVLPIPMVLLLIALASWVLSGTLVGHLFRDTAVAFHRELDETTSHALARWRDGERPPDVEGDVAFAWYRDGKKVGGLANAPAEWPRWMIEPERGEEGLAKNVPFVVEEDGDVTIAAAVEGNGIAALGVFTGEVDRELRERSGIWIELLRDENDNRRVEVEVFGRQVEVAGAPSGRAALREQFFGTAQRELAWVDRPILAWVETLGHPRELTPEGAAAVAPPAMIAVLNGTPRTVYQQVVSSTSDVDAATWGLLLVAAFLLFDVYVAATLMALFMIYGLSRAVNRLSKATTAVRAGDFSLRIGVRRRDQLGELQRSYNEMAEGLEQMVLATAQKESLEKELQVARELQQSLLPSSLTTTEAVELASYFEPSAAIGGDYFDLLKIDAGRLAIVVADVSGHGLSAGLRMAMLKAALVMLVEQRLDSHEVFSRLDRLVREGAGSAGGRPLVTATLAIFDPATGRLDLTNAGHTPTYWLRQDGVEEILLPSPPLGVLGDRYASCSRTLEPGDLVVWLSDGLIESADPSGDPFGFERVQETLVGTGSATQVRDRLLAAVAKHSQGAPPADDRTLVVLRYLPVLTAKAPAPQAAVPERVPEEPVHAG
jgi:serine phosphatase RsbU (regulator of sigma subunit)